MSPKAKSVSNTAKTDARAANKVSGKSESKKKKAKKTSKAKVVQAVKPKPIEESEKIPFSEVGSENNVVVPPPVTKPVAPVVKVRNRTPLPMPTDNFENSEQEPDTPS